MSCRLASFFFLDYNEYSMPQFPFHFCFQSTQTTWPGLQWVLYINCTHCTQTSFATGLYTCVQYTVYRSIAELFKSDDDVKISTETEDVVVTEEVRHISN